MEDMQVERGGLGAGRRHLHSARRSVPRLRMGSAQAGWARWGSQKRSVLRFKQPPGSPMAHPGTRQPLKTLAHESRRHSEQP